MENKVNCPVCDTEVSCQPDYHRYLIFYSCHVCGRYELDTREMLDHSHLDSYLFYNRFNILTFNYEVEQ